MEVGQFLKENLKTQVDPCEDFYNFACGKYGEENVLPGDRYYFDVYEKIHDKARDTIYEHLSMENAANEIRPIKFIRQVFIKATDEKILEKNDLSKMREAIGEMKKSKTLEDLIIITSKNGFPSLLHMYIDVNPTAKVVQVYQGWYDTFGDERKQEVKNAYYKFVSASIRLLHQHMDQMQADDEARQIVKLQEQLDEFKRSTKMVFTSSNKSQLSTAVKGMDFARIIDGVLGEESTFDKLTLHNIECFEKLATLAKDNLQRVISLLEWKLIETYGWCVSSKFIDYQFKYEKFRFGVKEKTKQQEHAYNVLVDYAPNVVGRLFIDMIGFEQSERKAANEMILKLRSSMAKLVEETEWMDKSTKVDTMDRLKKLKFNIGYPEWIKDDAQLSKSLDIDFTDSDGAFELIWRLKKFVKAERAKQLHPNYKLKSQWSERVSPADATLDHHVAFNTISLPAGFLNSLFHHPNRPKYLNLGSAGVLIAQELCYGLGFVPDRYDLHNWWSGATLEKFRNLAKKMISQYSSIIKEMSNSTVEESEAIDDEIAEFIAENCGLRVAHRIYFEEGLKEPRIPGFEDWSGDKMFFLAFANTMCESSTKEYSKEMILHSRKYRVNVPLSNFDAFAKAYKCKPGSKMNPKDKVRVW